MKYFISFILAAGLLLAPWSALQAKVKEKPAGVVTSVLGRVEYHATALESRSSAKHQVLAKKLHLGQQVYAGDRVKTGANGRAVLVLSDGTQLKVNYETDITLQAKNSRGKVSDRGISAVKILFGRLWARVTKKSSRFEFITPAAVAAVKGTTPEFNVDPNGDTCIKLWEGKLDVDNDKGSLAFKAMTQACIKKGFAPPKNTDRLKGNSDFDDFNETKGASLFIQVDDRSGQPQEIQVEYEKK